jgi:hypothetical protein
LHRERKTCCYECFIGTCYEKFCHILP